MSDETMAIAADQPAASVPATEVNSSADQNVESASTQTETTGTEITEEVKVAEPSEKEVQVKELIAQRKRRQEAEKEAAYWRGIAEGRAPKQEPVVAPKVNAPQPITPPSLDDFDTYEEWQVADREYTITAAEARIQQRFEAQRQQQAAQRQAQEQQNRHKSFNAKMEAESKSDPMIMSIMTDETLPLHPSALPVLYDSDVAPDLLRALNKDRVNATRIYHLFNSNPVLAARELGKLEAIVASKPRSEPPKKVSGAPDPIKTVTPAGSSSVDEDSLPMEEYYKRYNKRRFGR